MQDHKIPNAKLPSPTELFTDEAFEPGKEIADFGILNNTKIPDEPQQNKITDVEDELDKYLGKKSSGISSYTRKNSVDSSGGHGISESGIITKPHHHLINNDENTNVPLPSWKLTFFAKKVQKTNYSQVAANIREKNKNTNQNMETDLPPLDPRKGSHRSGKGSYENSANKSGYPDFGYPVRTGYPVH